MDEWTIKENHGMAARDRQIGINDSNNWPPLSSIYSSNWTRTKTVRT